MPYTVYSCGSNGNYQLGNATSDDCSCLSPSLFNGSLTIPTQPAQIVCGGNHTLMLLVNGEVWAAGDNSHGQCGIAAEDSHIRMFRQVPLGGLEVVSVSAGWEFSVLATAHAVYVCGLGLKGELGLGKGRSRSLKLGEPWVKLVLFPTTILLVHSSLSHSVVVLENNLVYGWGNGRRGQLATADVHWEPVKVEFPGSPLTTITDVCLGREFTVVSGKSGDEDMIVFLGRDTFDIQTGLKAKPQHRRALAMWSSVHLLGDTVVSLGNNSHGQMYPADSGGDAIHRFAVGSEHGLVQFDNHKVWSWGWGEHGNCGEHSKPTESVTFDYLNLLHDFGETKVVLIEGGCATSWVVCEISDTA
ncbi:hypothetical protein BABINDRAFT_9739 [Babjeviella inositovora NRRL Y-12698]|uniref:Uncharacterized protein n=1 Tax=Babjeviella inositovora NRRL Y-12698 TaxID=984486 RepID=A0A1E3QJ88_9ASCO|nr:uncharacterized protein BABINDRAFT_9739 [Babjeviella inositovora NRRL Y-12698]ODQ77749.1 hypothetical protein BABINDRAFT_9739 [Babjeviella inositovora NRRL Y-12698]